MATYTFELGRRPASGATVLVLAEIPIVGVYAYFLLGEWMTLSQIVGLVMVIGEVLVLLRQKEVSPKKVG